MEFDTPEEKTEVGVPEDGGVEVEDVCGDIGGVTIVEGEDPFIELDTEEEVDEGTNFGNDFDIGYKAPHEVEEVKETEAVEEVVVVEGVVVADTGLVPL